MEQLVWAIIIIVFILFTVLKNRARNRPESTGNRETEHQAGDERDKLNRYLEKILGIEIPEREPQIRIEKSKPKSVKKRISPGPEPILQEKVCEPEVVLDEQIKDEWETPVPEKKNIYDAGYVGERLLKKDFRNAIILSEIIGPPISKRKNHRLF